LKQYYKGENDLASLATGFFCVRRQEELISQVNKGFMQMKRRKRQVRGVMGDLKFIR
jgi:hypothetical protein